MSLDVMGSFKCLDINVNDVQDARRWRTDVGKLVRLVHTVVTGTRVTHQIVVPEPNDDVITARAKQAAYTNGTLPTRLSEGTNEVGAAPVTQGPSPVGTIQVIAKQLHNISAGTYEEQDTEDDGYGTFGLVPPHWDEPPQGHRSQGTPEELDVPESALVGTDVPESTTLATGPEAVLDTQEQEAKRQRLRVLTGKLEYARENDAGTKCQQRHHQRTS